MSKMLWQIFVPTQLNDGTPIRTRRHREWDKQVRRISGGLTILKPGIGQWINPDGILFHERVIPVLIIATRKEIDKIINLTLEFYQQEAVACAKLSDEVIIRHRVVKA